ncbi:hypothetical protein ABG067_007124 [Albugo candida]
MCTIEMSIVKNKYNEVLEDDRVEVCVTIDGAIYPTMTCKPELIYKPEFFYNDLAELCRLLPTEEFVAGETSGLIDYDELGETAYVIQDNKYNEDMVYKSVIPGKEKTLPFFDLLVVQLFDKFKRLDNLFFVWPNPLKPTLYAFFKEGVHKDTRTIAFKHTAIIEHTQQLSTGKMGPFVATVMVSHAGSHFSSAEQQKVYFDYTKIWSVIPHSVLELFFDAFAHTCRGLDPYDFDCAATCKEDLPSIDFVFDHRPGSEPLNTRFEHGSDPVTLQFKPRYYITARRESEKKCYMALRSRKEKTTEEKGVESDWVLSSLFARRYPTIFKMDKANNLNLV